MKLAFHFAFVWHLTIHGTSEQARISILIVHLKTFLAYLSFLALFSDGPKFAGQVTASISHSPPDEYTTPFSIFMKRTFVDNKSRLLGWEYCGKCRCISP